MYRILLGTVCLMLVLLVTAQPKDTTEKFSPESTVFFYESTVSENLDTMYALDTTLHGVHRWEKDYREDGLFLQNLNGWGSAVRDIYFETPYSLGREFGFDAYNVYVPHRGNIKYFDTKASAFSEAFFYQDYMGQQAAGILVARNFNERSSFTFDFDKYATERIVGSNAGNEIFTDNYTLNINLRYASKDSSYKALAYYTHFNHTAFDNWGGDVDYNSGDSLYIQYFDPLLSPRVLSRSVETEDRRNNWHLFHQWAPIKNSELLQVYHSFDRSRRKSVFRDNAVASHFDLYPNVLIDSSETNDSTVFEVYTNEVGFKGGKRNYQYSAYARDRRFVVHRGDSVGDGWDNEQYLGGRLQIRFEELKLEGTVELGTYGQSMIRLKGNIYGLEATLNNVVKRTSVLENRYHGNHFEYTNNFDNEAYRSLKLAFNRQIRNWRFNPYYQIQSVNNKVFYVDSVFQQYNTEVAANIFGVQFNGNWGKLFVKSHTRYQLVTDPAWWRSPELYSWMELYLQFYVKRYATWLQFGFDAWYRSEYYGYGYDPALQQFTPDDEFLLEEYASIDLFMSAKVFHYKFFLKWNHLNQLWGREGYFVTPYYAGQEASIELGLVWQFYD